MTTPAENILFLWNNAVPRGTVSAPEVATLPASNLQTVQRSEVWRSPSGTSVDIDITLDSAEEAAVAIAGLVDHNLGPEGKIRLRGWSDALGGSNQVEDVTVTPWESVYGYGVGGYGANGYGGALSGQTASLIRPVTLLPLSDYHDALYWRMTLTDPDIPYFEAAVPYLGDLHQMANNMSWGWRLRHRPRTRFTESRGGQRYGAPQRGRFEMDLPFDLMDQVDKSALWQRYLQIENHNPLIVCARPIGGFEQLLTSIYCHFEGGLDTADHHVDDTRTTLKLVEEL